MHLLFRQSLIMFVLYLTKFLTSCLIISITHMKFNFFNCNISIVTLYKATCFSSTKNHFGFFLIQTQEKIAPTSIPIQTWPHNAIDYYSSPKKEAPAIIYYLPHIKKATAALNRIHKPTITKPKNNEIKKKKTFSSVHNNQQNSKTADSCILCCGCHRTKRNSRKVEGKIPFMSIKKEGKITETRGRTDDLGP